MAEHNSTKQKSFIKHAAIYGFGTVLLQGASALLLPLYTYYLSPAEFGILEVINRTGEIFQIVLMANGIRLAALTFYRQAQPGLDQDRVAPTVTLLVTVLLVSGGVVGFLLRDPIAALIGVGKPDLLFVGMVSVLLQATTAVPLTLIQARVESLHYIVVGLAMLLVRVVLLVIVLVWLGWGLWGVFGATAVTAGVFGIGLTFRELARSSFRPDFSKVPEFTRFIFPFVPTGLCFFVMQNGDRFFLLRHAGDAEVGIYSLAYRMALALGMLAITPFRRVWSARMFDEYASPIGWQTVGRAVRGQLSFYLFAGVGLCILREEVLGLLAPPEYGAAALLMVPLLLAFFFWNASNFVEGSLYAFHRTALKPLLALASTVVIILLYSLLIPRFGAIGAAFATLGGFIFHAALTYVVTQRVFAVKYDLYRIGGLLALAGLSVAVAETFDNNLLGVSGKIGVWLVWPVVAWWTALLDFQEKLWAREQFYAGLRFAKKIRLPSL